MRWLHGQSAYRDYSPPGPLRPGELSGTSAWVFFAEFFARFLLFLDKFLLVFLKLLFLFFAIISPIRRFSDINKLNRVIYYYFRKLRYYTILLEKLVN